jgi:hypothetical protein
VASAGVVGAYLGFVGNCDSVRAPGICVSAGRDGDAPGYLSIGDLDEQRFAIPPVRLDQQAEQGPVLQSGFVIWGQVDPGAAGVTRDGHPHDHAV